MAAPLSLNLLGEIGLLSRLVSWSWFLIFVLVLLSFFSAAYTLYLYSYSQHGIIYSGLYSCSLGHLREFFIVVFTLISIELSYFEGVCVIGTSSTRSQASINCDLTYEISSLEGTSSR